MAVVIQTLSDSAQARKDLSDLKNSVLGIQQTTKGLADKFSKIGGAIALAAGGTGAVLAFTRLSDSFTNLKNSLNSVSDSAADAKSALNAIYDISLRTRTPIEATSKLFTKLTMASKDLGASQVQIAAVTNAINQGFKISGAGASESAAAITQLSQAFASGKLAGDEFNSVLENAPFLARQITEGMGINLKQLYQLRDAGKLYSKDVFGAILKQTGKINEKFRNLKVTFGDAFSNMGTAFKLLFDSISTTILGSDGGGFAEMINNWALGIANFARNFRFYILRAKTTAILFVIDVTEFFVNMWKRITEDGPQAIVDMFKELVTYLSGGNSIISVYAKKLYDGMIGYVNTFYVASSAMFFGFLAWLRKSQATAGLADTLEAMNNRLLQVAKSLGAVVSKIDFKGIFQRAADGIKAVWNRLLDFNWSKLFANMGANISKAFASLKNVDVNKFFPMLSTALQTVKEWAQKVVHWFWWIYDEVIGHSYIPDLIEGILAWTSKLMGGPLGFFKKFALGATAALSSISFKGGVGKIGAGLKSLTKLGLLGGLAVGGAYAFKDQLGLTGVFDEYGPKVVAPMQSIVDKFDGAVRSLTGFSLVDKVKDISKWWSGNFMAEEQNPITGKVRQYEAKRVYLADQLHIPRSMQAGLAVGLAGAITLAMQLGMNSGTTKSVVMGLFTTFAGVAIARGIKKEVTQDFFLGLATKFTTYLNKGFEMVLGKKISEDPFGFLALVAKLSLLFKAGREYFLTLLKNVAMAPSKAGGQLANVAAVGGLSFQSNRAEKSLATVRSRSSNQIAMAQRAFSTNFGAVEARLGPSAARDAVNRAKLSSSDMRQAAPDVRAAAQAERLQGRLTDQQARLLSVGQQRLDSVKDALKVQKEANAKVAAEFKQGARNFGSAVGGAVGAGIGLSYSDDVVKMLANRRQSSAVEQLTNNKNVTIGGQTLDAGRAAKVASGEISIGDLDEASRKFAAGVVKGMEVPKYQQLAAQFGTIAASSFAVSAFGAMATGLAVAVSQSLLSPVVALAWAGMRKAGDAIAWVAFRVQYYAIVLGTAAIQRTIQVTAAVAGAIAARAVTIAGGIAAGVASGAAAAASFLIGLVGWPAVLAAALIAAVVGAAYLIYKYWDEIKAAGKFVGDLLYKAIMDPFGFWTREFPSLVLKAFTAATDKLGEWWDKFKKWWDDEPAKAEDGKAVPPIKRASGGMIRGPGTGTSDSILARLSHGEFVIRASQVQKYGPLIQAINDNKPLPQFASGGSPDGVAITSNSIAARTRHRAASTAKAPKPGDALAAQMKAARADIVVHAQIGDRQADVIGAKIAEAMDSRSRLLAAAAKASSSIERAAALRTADEWSSFIDDATSSKDLLSQSYSSALPGGMDDKEKKPKKKSRDSLKKLDFTFNEELDKINEFFPNLNLSMDEFTNLSGETRKQLFDLMAPLYNMQKILSELPAGSGQAFDYAKQLKAMTEKAQNPATDIANTGRSTYGRVAVGMKRAGLEIDQSQFQTFSPEFIKTIEDYNAKQNAWADAIKADPLNDSKIRDIRIKMRKSANELQTAIDYQSRLNSTDFYTKASVKFDKANVNIDSSTFNSMSDAAIATVTQLADEIIALQKQIEDGTDENTRRINTQRIGIKRDKIESLAVDPNAKARDAGASFAQNMRGAITEGMQKVFRGKFDVMSIVYAFRDNLINNFVTGLADKFIGKDSLFDNIMRNVGSGSISPLGSPANDNGGGKGIFSAIGGLFNIKKTSSPEPTIGQKVSSGLAKTVDKAGEGVAGILTDTAPTIGTDISGGIIDFAPKIGADIGSEMADTVGKASGGLSAGGAASLGAAGGSLFGLLLGKLFSEGGAVSGAGTSTSDSIPARLSNGEFVVKAKQVKKYRPLINAINDDTVAHFAEGGLVGSIGSEPLGKVASIERPEVVSSSKQEFNIPITGDISRQTRKHVAGMIPEIAAGVNRYNKEKGYR